MYKVLYRKFRPRRFSDVVGQQQVTITLQNELKNGRISHAYLFTGTRGTGKTTCAKILAKAVNCLSPVDGDACGKCVVCKAADEGTLLDIMEIDAASNNGVDSIRALIEESNFTPASAKYRVYIIDEVHMLSVAAFNALLKTLEEPPAHVIFILATTEVHRLLPTILSRCQRFDFRRIAPEDVADRLLYIAKKEEAQLEREAALLIAQITDGTLRDAISILDQCLSRSDKVTEKVVTETAGIANRDYLITLTDAVINSETSGAIDVIDTLYKNAKDMARLCEEMTEYFRGLMLVKTMRKPEKVLNASSKEMNEMKRQALIMELTAILHGLSVFEEAQNRMRFGNARTEMEMSFVKLCQPELDSSPEALIVRIEALEKRRYAQPFDTQVLHENKTKQVSLPMDTQGLQETPSKAKSSNNSPVQDDIDQASSNNEAQSVRESAISSSSNLSVEALSEKAVRYQDWPEILDQIKRYSRSVAAAFHGSAAYVNGEYMLIDAPQLAFDLLKRQSQREQVRDVIRQATGRVYKLGPYRKPEKTSEQDEDPLDALAQKALEAGIEVTELEGGIDI